MLRLAGAAVVAAGTSGVLAACGDGGQGAGSSATGDRPNLLVITADDMRPDELAHLPNLRSLAAAGVTFTSFRVPTPMCNPARAMFLTGQRATGPNGTGVVSQRTALSPTQEGELLPRWLREAGYETGLVGKYFTDRARPTFEHGWSFVRTSAGEQPARALGYQVWDGTAESPPETELRQEERWAQECQGFIESTDAPWFLWFASTSPHGPHEPTEERLDEVGDLQWPYEPEDVSSKPSWVRAQPEPAAEDVVWMQGFERKRLAELLELDANVGRLLAAIESSGQSDRTVVAFWSDNANALLEHRIAALGKGVPYDVAMRVPLIMAGPGLPAGVEVDALTYGPDLTATVVELAGAVAGIPQDGASLLPAVEGAPAPDRALLGYVDDELAGIEGMPAADVVITDDRKLIRYREPAGGFAEPTDRFELYDLDVDPDELVNVAWDPARLAERDALEARLDALLSGAA